MKPIYLLFIPALLGAACLQGQNAWHGDITLMLARVPVPASSSSCFSESTTITDPGNVVTVKDNGLVFTGLEKQLEDIMKAAMAGVSAQGPGMAPPGADQIAQMQQQGMQQAAAAQSNPQQMAQQYRSNSGAPSKDEMVVMKLIGQAQMAAGRINQLSLEMAEKRAKIIKNLDSVKFPPPCPEVRQGSYVGPTCACTRGREVQYRTQRIAAMNKYVEQMAALIRDYLPKMKAETTIIDDMEAKAKYGEAVTNPGFRQMVVSIQRMGFGSVTSMLGISGDVWRDAAEEYALLVNAQSGASYPCKL